mmetsp:Transcript_89392/g.251732  ORF Transcript_89392/g.251732 Transcript_89392/m.251732 type:complete len:201 (-) Transcript_89392:193-795(-)
MSEPGCSVSFGAVAIMSSCEFASCWTSTVALSTAAVRPKIEIFPSSTWSVTPRRCAISDKTSSRRRPTSTVTSLDVTSRAKSFRIFSATAMSAGGPNKRTSCRQRSMWTRQQLCRCIRCKIAPSSCRKRVRINSAQTAMLTSFRGPASLETCSRTILILSSEPVTYKTPRARSKRRQTPQANCMTRRRRRPRRCKDSKVS